jgi:hypothetical protein
LKLRSPDVIRSATWAEVVALFHGHGGEDQAMFQCDQWADRFGGMRKRWNGSAVSLESWSSDLIAARLADMEKVEPRIVTDDPPRCDGLPAAVVRIGDRYGSIDGKHRLNKWAKTPGNYAVLVIKP